MHDYFCFCIGSKSQLLEHEVAKTRGIGWEPTVDEAYNNKFMIYQYVDQCEITREYIPSAMEQRHVDVAFTHSNRDEALKSIRAYISRDDQRDVLAEVEMSVKKRMQTDEFLDGNEDERGKFRPDVIVRVAVWCVYVVYICILDIVAVPVAY